MHRIGIMQGRLLPPQEGMYQFFPRANWATEFAYAEIAGIDSIEWIYDVYGEDANPISTEAGLDQVSALSQQHRVAVVSLCADYFMDRPLIRATPQEKNERVARLIWLASRCQNVGISRIVIPFVDNSSIRNEQELLEVTETLLKIIPVVDQIGVEIHLETSLSPRTFGRLLAKVPFKNLKVNYDSGNSASLGYKVADEFAAYGDRIGSVHIKDRVRGGGTVPLGEGDADIPNVMNGLKKLRYAGDFILQVARGTPGQEVEWARNNRNLVRSYLQPLTDASGLSR